MTIFRQKLIRLTLFFLQDGVKPTKKGISLIPSMWVLLKWNVETLNKAIQEKTPIKIHLGGGVFIETLSQSFYIGIRQWWLPIDALEPKPTRKGICLSPDQWRILAENLWKVEMMVPSIENECDECRPFRRLNNRGDRSHSLISG